MRETVESLMLGLTTCLIVCGIFLSIVYIDSKIYPAGETLIEGDAPVFTEVVYMTVPQGTTTDSVPPSVETPMSKEEVRPTAFLPAMVKESEPPPISSLHTEYIVDELFLSKDIRSLLSYHNDARNDAGVSPLAWSPKLAASAALFGHELAERGCVLAHSEGPYGENLFYSRKYGARQEPLRVDEVMHAFLDEKIFYNVHTGACTEGEICGHYTQIVWADTTDVGCARSVCLSAEREEVWVCHYSPRGNIEGLTPF